MRHNDTGRTFRIRPARRALLRRTSGAALALLLAGCTGGQVGVSRPVAATAAALPSPRLEVVGARLGAVPWKAPLVVRVTGATLDAVLATGPEGALSGSITSATWTSDTTLTPGMAYVVRATLHDRDGRPVVLRTTTTTTAATQVLHATLSPDSRTVGVGEPLIAQFDRPVVGTADRAAVLSHLAVTSRPAQPGAWHWVTASEAHYRGPAYWRPGTQLRLSGDLTHLRLPGTDVWGADGGHTATAVVADGLVSTVDVTAHVMTVRRSGRVLRVLKVSTGRDKYPTKGGVHVVLALDRTLVYDSATVGIPRASPDGYFEVLPFNVRISNGGAFVHANPATVAAQGVRNVSHGCVNLSTADAAWFFDQSHVGDVVDVVHAAVPPLLSDPGMADWNTPYAAWGAASR